MSEAKFYFFLTLGCLVVQGLFAMLEMASVSFNKVRLQYFVSQGRKSASWLSFLLQRPGLLFGTTLIMINLALQIGSESSRRFYLALGLNPDWAPVSQIFIVLIFSELSPMLVGRRYAEHVGMMGSPIIFFFSLILRPIIWLFDLICQSINRLFKSPIQEGAYLSREELQYLFEQTEELKSSHEINTIISTLFSLKGKLAKHLMRPLSEIKMATSFCTVQEMKAELSQQFIPYLPIYTRSPQHIVGIAYPRDLLKVASYKKVKDHIRPAWFITEDEPVLEILKQFRINNQSIAVVLNSAGLAVGILTLDEIVDQIFGRVDAWESFGETIPRMSHVVVDKTLPGDMKIVDFNQKFSVHLSGEKALTLEELMEETLGRMPEVGDTVRIDQFELTMETTSLIGPKRISVRTVF